MNKSEFSHLHFTHTYILLIRKPPFLGFSRLLFQETSVFFKRVQKEQLQIEIHLFSFRTPHFFSKGHPTRQRTPHFLSATPHKNQKSTPKTAVLKWVHFLSISSWQHKKALKNAVFQCFFGTLFYLVTQLLGVYYAICYADYVTPLLFVAL